jgi:hypothetical protein
MEDVSSFGREMIFHPRTDWERPPRFPWCTLLGSSSSRRCYKKLDLKQPPPTLLAGFVGSWRTLARHSGAILEVADTLYTSINVVTQNPVQGLLAECY